MTPFVLGSTPLEVGASLIEASAGTGKTHTIAGIFLRVLIESVLAGRPVHVDEILVVTYTDSATKELRDRIRKRLAEAAAAFGSGRSDDEFIQGLLRLCPERGSGVRPAPGALEPFSAGTEVGGGQPHFLPPDPSAVRERLRNSLVLALNCFDLAPIFTIHGFCQRALKDRAFESGALFDAEIMPDQSALLQEIADDYWRQNFYEASPLRIAVALSHGLEPGSFLRLARGCLGHADLKFLTRAEGKPAAVLAQELEAAFDSARVLWGRDRDAIEGKFENAAAWANKPYNEAAVVRSNLDAVGALLGESAVSARRLAALEFFATNCIAEKTRKKPTAPPPAHEFFDRCRQFVRLQEDFVTALQMEFTGYAHAELRARKEKLKLLSYDDLLTRLRDALRGPGGAGLASELRRKYRVALIDEFQDTDPVQWEIFRTAFASPSPPSEGGEGGGAEGRQALDSPLSPALSPLVPRGGREGASVDSGLFLIGDPKQAIYGFRGADIFTYMSAAGGARRRFTLAENWRSESGLVRAINTLFNAAEKPFVFDRIEFYPVQARGEANLRPLLIEGRREPPLHVWFCPRDGKPIPKGRAESELSRATAAEITRLLNGHVTIGGRPLRPQDIAVLTMTHKQAAQVQEALRVLRVPSVQQTQASVFASAEAAQVLRLLSGIAAPWNEPFVRAALSTELLGASGTDLGAIESPAWIERLNSFREWFDLWVRRGFTAMFRHLLDHEAVRARLLALPEGERALTNVLHLAEVLHEAVLREKLGVGGLIQWLATRLEEQDAAEEHQLRLERDENAVQLVTVHKSKGLQYDIVLAPFCWRGSELKPRNAGDDEQEVLFHDPSTGGLVRDLGPEPAEDHVRLARRERLAENVRLLYVALTRARHRCYFAWGAFSGSDSSAPAWIFHHGKPGASWPLDFSEHTDEQMQGDVEAIVRASRDADGEAAMALSDLPQGPGSVYETKSGDAAALVRREFKGHVPRDWRVASFSGLVAGQREEAPDRDAAESPPGVVPAVPAPASGLFAFPRGSKAGTCLHKIFEQLDFTGTSGPTLEAVTQGELHDHGFPPAEWGAGVIAAVRNTLQVELDPKLPGFSLSRVGMSDRVTELEFCFSLRKMAVADLVEVFARHGRQGVQGDFPEQLGRLTFSPTRGYIKGFIDLVFRFGGKFWLADWKSNWLGNQGENYGPDALRREMGSRLYLLQYHLYVVALDRWLRLRAPGYDYARDFGGVFYLFLRGIDPARPEWGVFRDKPEPELIQALGTILFET